MFRFCLKLLFKKFNLLKTLRESIPVIQFGIGTGAFNLIFQLVRRAFALLRKQNYPLTCKKVESIIACCLASFGLTLMDSHDYRVVKIVVFSRAVSNAIVLFGDLTKLYKPVESHIEDKRSFTIESAIGLAATTFCCYCFVFEVKAMPPSLLAQYHKTCNFVNTMKY